MNAWKQLRAILLLPGIVTAVIPAAILYCTGIGWLPSPGDIILPVMGSILIFLGLALIAWTNRLFITVGKGSLAPWNPTKRLVVRGVYRHVRNPMILGVLCIRLGEAAFFCSVPLFGWFAVFCLLNIIYIPMLEEPGLIKRFGQDYLLYKRNVPRWIPRLRPWNGLSEDSAEANSYRAD